MKRTSHYHPLRRMTDERAQRGLKACGAVGASMMHSSRIFLQGQSDLLTPTVTRARSRVLTRRSAAAAAGVHTHTYSSAASETAAMKKAPVLLLLLLLLLLLSGPSPSARIDTDTAACSSDSTPADDVDTHLGSQQALVSWAFANCSWLQIEVAAADGCTWGPRNPMSGCDGHLLRCASSCWGCQSPAKPQHAALLLRPTLHTGHLL